MPARPQLTQSRASVRPDTPAVHTAPAAVHVHTERTCTGPAGGHFYVSEFEFDPWTGGNYTAAAGATASGLIQLEPEVAPAELAAPVTQVNGRSIIIHDAEGARIACALLGSAAAAASFVPPPPPPKAPYAPPGAPAGGCGGGCIGGIVGGGFVQVLLLILWLSGAFGDKCPSPLNKGRPQKPPSHATASGVVLTGRSEAV